MKPAIAPLALNFIISFTAPSTPAAGDLTVPKGATITMNNVTMKFKPTASFKVNNNAGSGIAGRVTFNTCTLTVLNACEANPMWQGVRVAGNGNLAQLAWASTPHAWVQFTNSQVDHAVVGVEIKDGGIVRGLTSTFADNNTSLSMTGYVPSTGTNNITDFDRCTFVMTSGTYLLVAQSYWQVFLINQKLTVRFYGCGFKNLHVPFNYQIGGIYGSSAKFSVLKKVVNVNLTVFSTFNNLYEGIRALSTNFSGRSMTCLNAIFTMNKRGIWIGNNDYCTINENTFKILDNAIYSDQYNLGLYIDQSMGFSVKANDFRNNSLAPVTGSLAETFGIIANNTNLFFDGNTNNLKFNNHVIYKNTFTNLNQGIQALNKNKFTILPAYDGGLKLECNIFNQTMLWCDIGVNSGTINPHQGYLSCTAGNQFSRTLAGKDLYSVPTGISTVSYLWHPGLPNGDPIIPRYTSPEFVPAMMPTAANTNICAYGSSQRTSTDNQMIVRGKIDRFLQLKPALLSLKQEGKSKGLNNQQSSKEIDDMYLIYDEASELKREIILGFLNDTLEGSLDSAYRYMNIFENIEENSANLVGTNLALGNVAAATSEVSNISQNSPGSNYSKLMELQLALNGKNIREELMNDPSKVSMLQAINSDLTDARSNLLANSYLNLVMYAPRELEIIPLQSASSGGILQSNTISENKTSALLTNVPNPYNSTTEITAVAENFVNSAKIIITDVLGREIATYNLIKGENKIMFQHPTNASSILYCTLYLDGKRVESKIMMGNKD